MTDQDRWGDGYDAGCRESARALLAHAVRGYLGMQLDRRQPLPWLADALWAEVTGASASNLTLRVTAGLEGVPVPDLGYLQAIMVTVLVLLGDANPPERQAIAQLLLDLGAALDGAS